MRIRVLRRTAVAACSLFAATSPVTAAPPQRFEVTVPATTHAGPLTGRLVLIVSKRDQPEPRLLVGPQGPAIFGVDLEQVAAGRATVVDEKSLGYPTKLGALPPGEYFVQAVVNVYDRVTRAEGPAVWLPMNDGTIEFFTTAAGNLYSEVQRVRVGPGAPSIVRLAVTKVLPPAERPADTEWVKHLRIQSQKLTKFWGRPIYIHATALLPRGYADHPESRYPGIYTFGHGVPFNFRTDSAGVRGLGKIDPVRAVETGYDFYKSWIADDFPRVVAITLQQQTPYFPDSYSVNSANNGPYGDAIVEEVMPQIEQHFRIIGKPYARIAEGASTNGWQTLSLQLKYPDFFGGAWVLQPDPIDFRRYLHTNIYEDTSAFTLPAGQFITLERPFRRTVEGQTVWSMRQLSQFEEVLGTRGRSGFQLGAWEAVYGPVGTDGYPRPLWNKLTGTIDREVANYMRDNGYDLREYAQRNWATIGPKLAGKLHFFAGDMDDFYLNLAVYQFEEFAKGTTNPKSDATFTYGRPMKGHSWHAWTWAEMVRQIATHIRKNAPAGEETKGWSY